jgi:CRP-like cAMP-binding protein
LILDDVLLTVCGARADTLLVDAPASIIANEDVEVYVIEGYYLDMLLSLKPGLSSRFHQYLADLLAKRLASSSPLRGCL